MSEMNDTKTTIQELKDKVAHFVQERDWQQFHSPKNLSMAISVETAELMEKFLWLDGPGSHQEVADNRQEIEDELADIVIALLAFSNACSINIAPAVEKKIEEIIKKYPVEKAKGRHVKYTKL